MQTIQEILTAAGHPCSGNNRNRAIKGCNTSLAAGVLIKVSRAEHTFTAKNDGVKYNIYASFAGRMVRRLCAGRIEAYDVLSALATLLQAEAVKAELSALRVTTPCECHKCKGRGVIPAFYYYANGVCFDCMGVGFRGVLAISK
jgi:hypothetical protein